MESDRQDFQEHTIGYVKVLYDQLHCICKRIGKIVKIFIDSNVDITLRTHNSGRMLHVAAKVMFLARFVYPLTRFVDKK